MFDTPLRVEFASVARPVTACIIRIQKSLHKTSFVCSEDRNVCADSCYIGLGLICYRMSFLASTVKSAFVPDSKFEQPAKRKVDRKILAADIIQVLSKCYLSAAMRVATFLLEEDAPDTQQVPWKSTDDLKTVIQKFEDSLTKLLNQYEEYYNQLFKTKGGDLNTMETVLMQTAGTMNIVMASFGRELNAVEIDQEVEEWLAYEIQHTREEKLRRAMRKRGLASPKKEKRVRVRKPRMDSTMEKYFEVQDLADRFAERARKIVHFVNMQGLC